MTAPDDTDESGSAHAHGLPAPDPDFAEGDPAEPLDNIVPTHGYALLPVVGLGGSAGAIRALQEFFDATPADTNVAYVVVLHLAPEHESSLPQILQRNTTMPVHAAQDGETIEPNCVYVIPPGKHLVAADGQLRLTEMPQDRGRRVVVDLFFRSLADTHGPHATAVVLSGADADGSIGLRRVKERGGLTIAQDPHEAEYPSMPSAAIATGMVDWVLRVGDMPTRIVSYVASESRLELPPEEGPQPAKANDASGSDTEALLREVLAFLRVRTGRDFTYYKRATIVRRISRRMQVTGVVDLSEYLKHLRTHPGEAGALLQDLLISVTNFFRDRTAFESVVEYIPELFRHKKPGEPVRVWSAACATGEEAYSLAILLMEHARTLESPPPLQVFGCDLDEEAIQVARAGFYPDTIAADVSEERLRRFFMKEPGGWRVRRELREMLLFATHDLLKDAPFSRMDMVSCRNLLIYLNRDAQARALEIFNFALKPGGLLFLGVSESIEEGNALFAPLHKKHRLYRHRPARRMGLSVATTASDGMLQRAVLQHERLKHLGNSTQPSREFWAMPAEADERDRDPAGAEMSAAELHFKLLGRFGPASLVVNAEHEILYLSENAHLYLQIPEGEPTRNLLLLVHPLLRVELRTALFRAGESGQSIELARRLLDLPGGQKEVGIRVTPGGELAADALLVLFEAHLPGATPGAAAPPSDALEPSAVVEELERELIRTKAILRETVEQHEASTEEFKASNEELQAMNEELRAAGEELETGREELQSVNEELTTVNAEFRDRVEQLARANSDLHNLISATQIATIFLGRDLEVMRYTPHAAPLFNLIAGDIGRPIAHLNRRLDYPQLAADAEEVLRTLVPVERELREDGRGFLARVLPYRTIDDRIGGVVLTFIDITERRRAERMLACQNESFEAAMQDAPLEESLAPLGRVAVEQAGPDVRCGFYIADRASAALRYVAGMPKSYGQCVDGFKIGADALACGLAIHTGKPVITPDVAKDPSWKDWLWLAEKCDFRSCWSFPIETERKVIDTFALYYKEPRDARPRDHAFAANITRAAAVIISRNQAAEEREKAQLALRESQQRLELIVENAREYAIFAMDLERRITSWNAGAQAILGYTHDEVIGQSADFIFTPADRAAGIPEQEAAKALSEGRAAAERWHVRRDGGQFWGSGVMTSMHDANNVAIGLVKIFRDQTGELNAKEALERSREELHAALQEAELARDEAETAGKAKDRFLAILSHELRAPLTPLLLAAQMLERSQSLPPNVVDALAIIRRNVQLEAQLIDDLLDVTRISTGRLELRRQIASIHEIIRMAVDVALPDIEQKKQRLTLDLAAAEDMVLVDGKRLQQTLWNLLKNASKFTAEGGAVSIRTRADAGRFAIEVSDSGIGFAPEVAERIFAAFEQGSASVSRKFGGLGLGLAICKAIVEAHGGTIRGSSDGPEKGAVFTVELPLTRRD